MSTDLPTSRSTTAIDLSLLIVRVIAGIVFMAHGSQKLFGAFGGPGMEALVGMMGLLAWPVAIGEFFGGVGLVFGFLSRFSAASLIVIMIGAIATVHGSQGFFAPKGFEYNLALIGLLAPTFLAGPGNYSVARALRWPLVLE